MERAFERPGTWYSLICSSLVEDAAGMVLTPRQAQSLMARLRAEHVFSAPFPDDKTPEGGGALPDSLDTSQAGTSASPLPGQGGVKRETAGEAADVSSP